MDKKSDLDLLKGHRAFLGIAAVIHSMLMISIAIELWGFCPDTNPNNKLIFCWVSSVFLWLLLKIRKMVKIQIDMYSREGQFDRNVNRNRSQ